MGEFIDWLIEETEKAESEMYEDYMELLKKKADSTEEIP